MKKQLLLIGLAGIGMSAMAEDLPTPQRLYDAYISAMSPNGVYAASQTYSGVKIFNLSTGKEDSYLMDPDDLTAEPYGLGLGKCISNNGIVLGGTDSAVQYWKDGEWYDLEVPDYASETNLANAITSDGSRICGSIGVGSLGMAMQGDVLMQAPCIWNATEDGFGMPVMLPHPDLDFTGRVPQYITAIDISDDGKTIIGQVMNASGFLAYPILYRENENGEWSYEIPHEDFLMPEGTVFPEYPGDGPEQPNVFDFMTEENAAAYNEALNAYWWEEIPDEPKIDDYMSEEEKAKYEAALAAYNVANEEWSEKFNAWFDLWDKCTESCPNYQFNSVQISSDGNFYGCTIQIDGESDPGSLLRWGMGSRDYNVWVFEVNGEGITKYDQTNDLNLTYPANNGIAPAATSIGSTNNSFVLSNGECEGMYDWMNKVCPEYASWIKENLTIEYEDFEQNPDTGKWDPVIKSELMTGRAMSTPDLSFMALSLENIWDYETEYDAFIFDLTSVNSVGSIRPASEDETIYDLSGRKLKSVTAPGIYIINGEKKAVR